MDKVTAYLKPIRTIKSSPKVLESKLHMCNYWGIAVDIYTVGQICHITTQRTVTSSNALLLQKQSPLLYKFLRSLDPHFFNSTYLSPYRYNI
jgi:hypothetical protein